jgi:hypothetical protein
MTTFSNQDDLKQYVLDELKKTDYTMLNDVYIANKKEFIMYRSFLRQALKNLYLSTQFPETPQPVWGNSNTVASTDITDQPIATGIQEV